MTEFESYLLEHFSYNPINGLIERSDRKNSTGSIDTHGYLILKIKGKQYKAHRIAWFLQFQEWPKNFIDHKNGNKLDNRLKNLRKASADLNNNNPNNKNLQRINSDTGVRGIYKDKVTKGLRAVYTFRIKSKVYRFRSLKEAVKVKKQLKGRWNE